MSQKQEEKKGQERSRSQMLLRSQKIKAPKGSQDIETRTLLATLARAVFMQSGDKSQKVTNGRK